MTDEVIARGHGGRQAATAEMARCLGHKEGALPARPMPFVPNTRLVSAWPSMSRAPFWRHPRIAL
jgi:hypothetical protein